jgi:hypothetical protein
MSQQAAENKKGKVNPVIEKGIQCKRGSGQQNRK